MAGPEGVNKPGVTSRALTQLSRVRKSLFWLLALSSVAWMTVRSAHVLEGVEYAALRYAILTLFVLCFTWIAVPFWTAMIGIVLSILRLDPMKAERERPLKPGASVLEQRTAVLMPVYNECAASVFGSLAAMYDALEERSPGTFDFFVLSDTRKAELGLREEQLCSVLRSEGRERLYYRRRELNKGKKAGNIADFVTRWGHAYENMIVLDADSILTGDLLFKLASLMETNPQAALIQTAPMVLNAETLFGRMIQFACRLCGPVITKGSVFLHGSDANYWGHNAIIRVKPFRELCGLGTLPGRPPLGGEILSHDFVEAALLSAEGWGVYLLPDASGSYEELPPTAVEYLQRDQRWSQGNLQHLKLLFRPGFRIHSRIFFLLGGFAYLSSPIWLCLLLLSTSDRVLAKLSVHDYFPEQHQLFPQWPISRQDDAAALFAATLAVLFLPKIGAALLTLRDSTSRKSFGGLVAMLWSILFETLFFTCFAPTMMLFHSWFVLQTLAGRKVQWNPQNREANGISLSRSLAITAGLYSVGALWGALLWWVDPKYLMWMSPIIFGLLIAPVLVWLSSSTALGEKAKASRLFLVPEEYAPSPIFAEARSHEARLAEVPGDVAVGELSLPQESPSLMPVNPIFLPGAARSTKVAPATSSTPAVLHS